MTESDDSGTPRTHSSPDRASRIDSKRFTVDFQGVSTRPTRRGDEMRDDGGRERRREGAKRGSARGCIEIETRCTPGALRETGPRRELVAMQCRYELHPRFISPHTATFPLPLPPRVKPRVKMYCLNKYKMSQCKNCVLKNKFFLIKEEN